MLLETVMILKASKSVEYSLFGCGDGDTNIEDCDVKIYLTKQTQTLNLCVSQARALSSRGGPRPVLDGKVREGCIGISASATLLLRLKCLTFLPKP